MWWKNDGNYGIQNLKNISSFNNYLKLLPITAYVIRLVNNLKQKVKKQSLSLQFLSPIDIENAEFEWIKIRQKKFSSNKSYFNQLNIKFGVFFDNQNILRCGGRLQFSDLPKNSKNPMLLSKHLHFSHLVTIFLHLQAKQHAISQRHYFTSSFKVLDC